MPSVALDWLHIIALLGAIQGIFLAGVLITKKQNQTANRVLAALTFTFTVSLLTAVYHSARLERAFPHFFGVASAGRFPGRGNEGTTSAPSAPRPPRAERVRVPAGEFDCWRLSIQFDGHKLSYWVRKSDGLGVRLYDDSQVATQGIREIALRSVR